jgi:hypothetical protein
MSKLKTYEVTITEELKRTIEVQAANAAEARHIVKKQHHESEIILDASDFKDVHFSVYEPRTTNRSAPDWGER